MSLENSTIPALAQFSTPSVLNGLKRLGLAPEQMQTMSRQVVGCISPQLGVRVGFAATRKVATRRSGGPSVGSSGGVAAGLLSVPAPRILVAENVGDWRGPVCIWGDVAANIHMALECRGGITNGPVRDVAEMEALGFMAFAAGVDVGGGYVDTLEVDVPVTVGGITVSPGDLLHADRHGIVKIPLELADDLPNAIQAHEDYERQIIEVCQRPGFTLEALVAAMSPR